MDTDEELGRDEDAEPWTDDAADDEAPLPTEPEAEDTAEDAAWAAEDAPKGHVQLPIAQPLSVNSHSIEDHPHRYLAPSSIVDPLSLSGKFPTNSSQLNTVDLLFVISHVRHISEQRLHVEAD